MKKTIKILIADDDTLFTSELSKKLSSALSFDNHYLQFTESPDIDITWAESVQKAINLTKELTFDLILLDIKFDIGDGFEVCSYLKNDPLLNKIPVIFITNFTHENVNIIKKCYESGGQDYITKDSSDEEIIARVKSQLEIKFQQELLENMNNKLEEQVQERTVKLKESNENLDKANKQLLVLDEAKTKFLRLISHEIRTPLMGIVGSADFLDEMIKDPELIDFLDGLKESAHRLEEFSILALDITQMHTAGNKIVKTNISVNSIIEDVVERSRSIAEEKQLTFSIILEEQDSLHVIRDYFIRSIQELINNAIKFSTENSDIEIMTILEGGLFKISFKQIGEIIPTEKFEEIVKPFGLAKEHYDKDNGLGLAYVKTFLDLHDASIDIESSSEQTKITLVFPI